MQFYYYYYYYYYYCVFFFQTFVRSLSQGPNGILLSATYQNSEVGYVCVYVCVCMYLCVCIYVCMLFVCKVYVLKYL